jgi:hypothetical protein
MTVRLQDLWKNRDFEKEHSFYYTIKDRLREDYSPATAWCFSKTGGMIDEYIIKEEEYAGVGAGAFGYLNGNFYANTCSVDRYIENIDNGTLPIFGVKSFPRYARMHYQLLMGLFGGRISFQIMKRVYGVSATLLLPLDIALLKLTGSLTKRGHYYYVTEKGRYLMVTLMREFFTAVNRLREICRAGSHQEQISYDIR